MKHSTNQQKKAVQRVLKARVVRVSQRDQASESESEGRRRWWEGRVSSSTGREGGWGDTGWGVMDKEATAGVGGHSSLGEG